jgi:hypothetical protein
MDTDLQAAGAVAVVAGSALIGNRDIDLSSRSRRLFVAGVVAVGLAVVAGWFDLNPRSTPRRRSGADHQQPPLRSTYSRFRCLTP